MTRVLVSTARLLDFLEGGGHFWVYMQYVEGLRALGCDVYLLDTSTVGRNGRPEPSRIDAFFARTDRYGLRDRVIVVLESGERVTGKDPQAYVGFAAADARDVFAGMDLLLNFNYFLPRKVVARFHRTALVDIDPGLLQFWISHGMVTPAVHDVYLTVGETVGKRPDLIADCGFAWQPIRPPVALEAWPYGHDEGAEAFTTVSSWWGLEYVGTEDSYYDNNKRRSWLDFLDLPGLTAQPLELALNLATVDESERALLANRGWRVRHAREVAATPDAYRDYIQRSRGEFSCAKPSCMRLQNAWVSDRTVCYLASGKPVVVQDTGPSSVLPNGEGVFRFRTLREAVRAFDAINADYERHCRLARELAEEVFDATKVARRILEVAL